MVLLKSEDIPMETPAPDFNDLHGIDGDHHSLSDFDDKKALVIIFMCVHCPYVQAIEEQIVAVQEEFGPKGVQVIAINPNDPERYPEDSLEGMRSRAEEYDYGDIVYVRDNSQDVAKEYGAVCTPDIFVYNEQRELMYHGRIEEVPQALETVLEGEEPDSVQIPSQGCSIKWYE